MSEDIVLRLSPLEVDALQWALRTLRCCKTPERPHLDRIERALKGEVDERA